MTNKELIEELKKYPEDVEVEFYGFDCYGNVEICPIKKLDITYEDNTIAIG